MLCLSVHGSELQLQISAFLSVIVYLTNILTNNEYFFMKESYIVFVSALVQVTCQMCPPA